MDDYQRAKLPDDIATIQHSHKTISLSNYLYRAIGSPTYICAKYDEATDILTICPSTHAEKHSYKVFSASQSTRVYIALYKYIELSPTIAQHSNKIIHVKAVPTTNNTIVVKFHTATTITGKPYIKRNRTIKSFSQQTAKLSPSHLTAAALINATTSYKTLLMTIDPGEFTTHALITTYRDEFSHVFSSHELLAKMLDIQWQRLTMLEQSKKINNQIATKDET